jgi:acid phosphatase
MVCIRIAILLVMLAALFPTTAWTQPNKLSRIEHIVVIYLENRSFDNIFGLFPGVRGIEESKKNLLPQVDEYGRPYLTLPEVIDSQNKQSIPDPRFPTNLPNSPFDIAQFVKLDERHPDLTHRFFIHQLQINNGHNDRFAQLSSAGGLSMGYYDLSGTALWRYAKEFTLADNFFQAAFGGSFLNHQWLICACTPVFPNAPAELSQWKNDPATGKPVQDPTVTADGYAVNTIQPFYQPFDVKHMDNRLPPQNQSTIGDRLSEKSISWAWYAGGWNDAVAGHKTDDNFVYHHQPFVYYTKYAPGTKARAKHLKDEKDLFADLTANRLPKVAFFKPVGIDNQHPGYATILDADRKVEQVVEAIRNSPAWPSTVIIITYDEYGGLWDHVAPPMIDRWGPGSRIPAIIISPFAKKGHVDRTLYDTTSILKLIETRFNLTPLTKRDANANGLQGALDFGK